MGDLESNDNQTVEKSLTTEDELKLIDGAISSQNDNADEEGNITLTALTQHTQIPINVSTPSLPLDSSVPECVDTSDTEEAAAKIADVDMDTHCNLITGKDVDTAAAEKDDNISSSMVNHLSNFSLKRATPILNRT